MAEQYIESAVTDPETAEHLSRIASVRQRLEKAGDTSGGGQCLLCGAPIRYGSICAKCKGTNRSGTTTGIPAGASGKRRYM